MKKIPVMFKKQYDEKGRYIGVINEITSGCEAALDGRAVATVKYDGATCMIKDMYLFKRYDVKPVKKVPVGAIPCQDEADAVTGHFPVWVMCNNDNPADKWFLQAYTNYCIEASKNTPLTFLDGTYEAIGPHFQNNPYNLDRDTLYKHGSETIDIIDLSYEGIKQYLSDNYIEGIVFWYKGEPLCKIRRKDFGFWWNKKECRRCNNGNIL